MICMELIKLSVRKIIMHACLLTPNRNEARREGSPASQEDVDSWFDKDGRLVKEAKMRQTMFEGIC